jgi:predicted alpha/beta superfamily hydrolase
MKTKFITLFLLASATLFAQRKKEEFYSSKLGENRTITIVTPPYYKDEKDKAYPLVIVLDGEYLLDPFAGTFNYTAYWDDLPEVILVSINQNKDNMREADTEYDPETGLPYGKGADFYEFITQELIPYIEEGYNVAPFRAIAGHGITAGFINAFLFKDKPVFNAYISLSPKLTENMELMLPARLSAVKKPVYYYMAVGDGDVGSIQKRTKILNDSLATVNNPVVKFKYEEFKDASHYAVAPRAIPSAIYHIFSCYQPISSTEYETKIVTLPSGYAKYLEDKYDEMEKNLGFRIPIRLNDFKAIEAAILKNGVYDELRDLGDLARKNYPKTIFGEYYTGLFFEMTGDKKRAIKTYVNSYSLKGLAEYNKDFMMEKAETIKSELKD